MVDLTKVHTEEGWRLGLDPEKVAAMLEQMAGAIRAGVVIPKMCEMSSTFTTEEWEAGRLIIEFNEKAD